MTTVDAAAGKAPILEASFNPDASRCSRWAPSLRISSRVAICVICASRNAPARSLLGGNSFEFPALQTASTASAPRTGSRNFRFQLYLCAKPYARRPLVSSSHSPGGPCAGLAPGLLIFFYDSARLAAAERLRLCGLPEGDPESVDVTNSELTHAVESIIEVHHDLNPVLEASVQLIDVLGGDVQVDLATVLRARFPLIGT